MDGWMDGEMLCDLWNNLSKHLCGLGDFSLFLNSIIFQIDVKINMFDHMLKPGSHISAATCHPMLSRNKLEKFSF